LRPAAGINDDRSKKNGTDLHSPIVGIAQKLMSGCPACQANSVK
jgi:hypothetical protein